MEFPHLRLQERGQNAVALLSDARYAGKPVTRRFATARSALIHTAPSTAAGISTVRPLLGPEPVMLPDSQHGHQQPLGDLLRKCLAHPVLARRDGRDATGPRHTD